MPQQDREPGQAAGTSVSMVEERQRQKKQQRRELLTGVAVQQLDAILTASSAKHGKPAQETESRNGFVQLSHTLCCALALVPRSRKALSGPAMWLTNKSRVGGFVFP